MQPKILQVAAIAIQTCCPLVDPTISNKMSSRVQRPFELLADRFDKLKLPSQNGSSRNALLFRRLALHHTFNRLMIPDGLQDLKELDNLRRWAQLVSATFQARYGSVLWPGRFLDDKFEELLLKYFLQLLQWNSECEGIEERELLAELRGTPIVQRRRTRSADGRIESTPRRVLTEDLREVLEDDSDEAEESEESAQDIEDLPKALEIPQVKHWCQCKFVGKRRGEGSRNNQCGEWLYGNNEISAKDAYLAHLQNKHDLEWEAAEAICGVKEND
jgi:hypothetical protein